MIRRLLTIVCTLLLMRSLAAQEAQRVPARAVEQPLPEAARSDFAANGLSIWRSVERDGNSMLHAVYGRCRLYLVRNAATSGELLYEDDVRYNGPKILDVRPDGKVLLGGERIGVFVVWSPGDPPLRKLEVNREPLRAPGGQDYKLMRANEYGLLAEDWNGRAYYFIPLKDLVPQLDARVELRGSVEQPRIGPRWIVWDRNRRDQSRPDSENHCDLVAYDCERAKLTEVPLRDCFQLAACEGDLLLLIRQRKLEDRANFEIFSFDLATGQATVTHKSRIYLHCVVLRDGIGYLLDADLRLVAGKFGARITAIDFRTERPPLFVRELPPASRVQTVFVTKQGLAPRENADLVIPWAVRP
jgi:hypothetical protein